MSEVRTTRTRVVQEPYTVALHPKLAEMSDPLAQQCLQELVQRGAIKEGVSFSVRLQMRPVSGGPSILVDAIRFDPSYDFDAEVRRWNASTSTGYQRFSEMPSDAPFRVHGKSQGSFEGLWIGTRFKRALEQQSDTKLSKGDIPAIVEAITVEACAQQTGFSILLEKARRTIRKLFG